MTLACVVLYNIWINVYYETPKNWDINYQSDLKHRSREKVAQLLMLTDYQPKRDTCKQAAKIRDAFCRKFWAEHEMGKNQT